VLGIVFIEDEPTPTVDNALDSAEASAPTSQLSLIVDPVISHEWVYNCDDGGRCASVDTQSGIDYVCAVDFKDIGPSLNMSYDMDLLDSVNVN
jgi:hypothetical protein